MLIRAYESSKMKNFFDKYGIDISGDSCFNYLRLVDKNTGEALSIWAELDIDLPGIFIDENNTGE